MVAYVECPLTLSMCWWQLATGLKQSSKLTSEFPFQELDSLINIRLLIQSHHSLIDVFKGEEAGAGPTHVPVDLLHQAARVGATPAEPSAPGLHGGCVALLH